jgi:hypothetical protein
MELRFGQIGRPVASVQVAMFHASAALLAAPGTGPSLIELLGLLSLDGLVEFRGSQFTDLMTKLFDLVPSQLDRWAVLSIGLGANHPAKFLHLLEDFGRKPRTTFIHCF